MSTRRIQIQKILRVIYNGFPPQDGTVTEALVNVWLNEGIGAAVNKNFADNLQIEGIGFVNGSFYTTYKGISPTDGDTLGVYEVALPQVPIGIGRNEGVAALVFKNGIQTSYTSIPLTINQAGYNKSMRPIPNKVKHWYEGETIYVESGVDLKQYTAQIRMISGGDFNDLDSTLFIPDNYLQICTDYIKQQLLIEKSIPQDLNNDGNEGSIK